MQNVSIKGFIYAALSSATFGLAPFFTISLLLAGFSSFEVLAYRWGIASLTLVVFGIMLGEIKETKAPAGYRLLKDPIKIDIKATYSDENRENYVKGDGATDKTLQKLEATAHFKEFYSGKYSEQTVMLRK